MLNASCVKKFLSDCLISFLAFCFRYSRWFCCESWLKMFFSSQSSCRPSLGWSRSVEETNAVQRSQNKKIFIRNTGWSWLWSRRTTSRCQPLQWVSFWSRRNPCPGRRWSLWNVTKKFLLSMEHCSTVVNLISTTKWHNKQKHNILMLLIFVVHEKIKFKIIQPKNQKLIIFSFFEKHFESYEYSICKWYLI